MRPVIEPPFSYYWLYSWLVDLMKTEWTNPFSVDPTELISLSTGTVAPADVAIDLLTVNVQEHSR